MRTKWIIDEGRIYYETENKTKIYLSSKDLSTFTSKYINCQISSSLSQDTVNIRISSIIVNTIVHFFYIESTLSIGIDAIKRGKKYNTPLIDGRFQDYIIINDTLYVLGGNYKEISEIIIKNCKTPQEITLKDYVLLKRIFTENNIVVEDEILNELHSIKKAENAYKCNGLQATLYPYQDSGCNWLSFMVNHGCGCILGDEMGLGKTLQIIALIGQIKESRENIHSLVICPVSLLENWKREIQKFYPSLTTYIHHGQNRTGLYTDIINFDTVIVSYNNVQSDLSMFNMINWDLVIIDEAQNIKNPLSKRARNIKLIKRDISIAVTGTPFENHMTDIWSLADFVMPGYLGTLNQFNQYISDDIKSATYIEQFISPIMLRRRVKEVAQDLPKRVDIPVAITMTESEAQYYETERSKTRLEDLRSMKIEKIQRLRMFCTHPFIYNKKLTRDDPFNISNKYQRLCEIVEDIVNNNEKAVIFTSFNEMIDLIVNDFKDRFNIYTDFINGDVPAIERQNKIDNFGKIEGAAVLVLNPRAAGAGLNITCANHAIHYNLEWNPSIEDQASARIYRHGQEKNVFIYRLFYANTIEDIINKKIELKRELSETAIVGNKGELDDSENLIEALNITPYN